MSYDKRKQLIEELAKARGEVEGGKLSRRDFNSLMVQLGILTGFSLAQVEEASAWVGTRMRKPKRASSSGGSGSSLRFDLGRSTYLSRSMSSGNQRKFTMSAWLKLGSVGTYRHILTVAGPAHTAGADIYQIYLGNDNTFEIYGYPGSLTMRVGTAAVYRDPSAWAHFVVAVDTTHAISNQRVRMYVNGNEITNFANSTFPSQNLSTYFNSTYSHVIGHEAARFRYPYDGYISNMHWVDGQALTPWSFADIDPTTGQLLPKTFSGTYGTNGFNLRFADSSTVAALGTDSSGNANTFSVSGHAVTDNLLDSPSTNYPTLNPLDNSGGTMTNGNLVFTAPGASHNYTRGTVPLPTTGKWYWEYNATTVASAFSPHFVGFFRTDLPIGTPSGMFTFYINNYAQPANQNCLDWGAGFAVNVQTVNAGYTQAANDTIQFAYDADTGNAWIGANGNWFSSAGIYTGNPGTGANPTTTLSTASTWAPFTGPAGAGTSGTLNFGQGGLSGLTYSSSAGGSFKQTPPAGFKALSTANLPAPAVVKPGNYFQAITYTGNGGIQRIGEVVPSVQSYQVARSLRFNTADFLNRTHSAGNRKTFTLSCWLKRGAIGTGSVQAIFAAGGGGNRFGIFLDYSANSIDVHGNGAVFRRSTLQFTDTASWHHLVVAVDTTAGTAAARMRIYFDGSEITSFSINSAPGASVDLDVNSAVTHCLGRNTEYADSFFSGLMAEVYFVEGQMLTAGSFGEADATTGEWVPKTYSGSYGTNGFYLKFSDNSNTTAATLGKDSSGNGNNWTPNTFSVAAGAGNDSLTDTPTNYGADSGTLAENGPANYCTFDYLTKGSQATLSHGNLDVVASANNDGANVVGTLAFSSGKWYAEFKVTNTYSYSYLGLRAYGNANDRMPGHYIGECGFEVGTGQLWVNVTGAPAGYAVAATYSGATAGQTVMMAVDMDAGKVWWGINGTWFASGNPATGAAPHVTGVSGTKYFCLSPYASSGLWSANFGQRPFSYAPPAGFKCLNTKNLPSVDSRKMSGTPDLVWIKSRSAGTDHAMYDTARGVQQDIASNFDTAGTTQPNGLTSFTKTGFQVGSLAKLNTAAATYTAWLWKKGVAPGFDIVTYAGNATNRTISHGLGVAPGLILLKQYDHTDSWCVYHRSIAPTNYMELDTPNASAANAAMWNSTAPTSSVFSVGTANRVNESGKNHVAYLWAEVPGFSKFTSYVGTASTDGPFIWCGFRPAYVMIKCSSHGSLYWNVMDARRAPDNLGSVTIPRIYASTAFTESADVGIDFLANGIKIREGAGGALNESGKTYIVIAFAEAPFKYAVAR